MIVDVYWNSHRNCWSVRRHNGRLHGHAGAVLLHDATFKVRQAGRNRVLESGCKNVHAFVTGTLAVMAGIDLDRDTFFERTPLRVRYNPKECEHFEIAESGEPIHQARKVLFRGERQVWVPRPAPASM